MGDDEDLLDTLAHFLVQRTSTVPNDICIPREDYAAIIFNGLISRGKTAFWLSLAGALGASAINLIANRLRSMANRQPNQQPLPGMRAYLQERMVIAQQTMNRSAVGSTTGFLARIGINMITGGSDLWVNTVSRVVADSAAKLTTQRFPQYTGQHPDSWQYTVCKAATSATVGTLTYYFATAYTQEPAAARFVSASASAVSEQAMDYVHRVLF